MSRRRLDAQRTDGFSLIEVVVAMGILAVGLLSLVGVFAVSVQRMNASTPMLIAREIPPYGGDTEFASQYAAYEALSEGMRRLLDDLYAIRDR